MNERPWLTRQEAADYARVSISTIDRAIRRGTLRATKPGGTVEHGAVRLRVEWVDAWLLGRGSVQIALLGAATGIVAACVCHLGINPTHPRHAHALPALVSALRAE